MYANPDTRQNFTHMLTHNIENHGISSELAKSLGHHHLNEFLVVDLSITIQIRPSNHFIDFFVGQFFTEICHHVSQLGGRDETERSQTEPSEMVSTLAGRQGVSRRMCVVGLSLGLSARSAAWPGGT